MNAFAGEQTKVTVQTGEVIIESHGILHTIIEIVPGGEWTVLGGFFLGMGTLAWWKFGKHAEGWVIDIVKQRLDKRLNDDKRKTP